VFYSLAETIADHPAALTGQEFNRV